MKETIDIPLEKIQDFCTRWKVIELSLFGSILREDFNDNSDIDVMVQFDRQVYRTFADLDDMEAELAGIFNRTVDLVTRNGIENSRNYLRRQEILTSAKAIYEQRQSIST